MNFILTVYLYAVNIAAFLLYGMDKHKAAAHKWRIPETMLLGISACGGGIGAFLGMLVWHHKTRKWKFRLLVPLFTVLWLVLLTWIFIL